MQTTGISGSYNLSMAINCLEEILNKQDGESVIQTIKNYKQSKDAGGADIKNS